MNNFAVTSHEYMWWRQKYLRRSYTNAFSELFHPFIFFPLCNAPLVFQVHGTRYPTGGNYFVPYREFRPPERGCQDSYEDINTPYIPRTPFPSALLKSAVQSWLHEVRWKSSVFMAHLVWDFSSGTASKSTDFDHFLLMQTNLFCDLGWY